MYIKKCGFDDNKRKSFIYLNYYCFVNHLINLLDYCLNLCISAKFVIIWYNNICINNDYNRKCIYEYFIY